MNRISKNVVVLLGVLMLMAVLASCSPAQTAVIVSPAPRVSLLPARPWVSYYAPTTTYYSPAPVVSYYTPPAVSYYAPPAVSYYAPPAVSYYAPASSVTTYRGILPWRSYSAVRYYGPGYYYP
ncbi:MAG TPA: hypothetical protein VGX70_13840 [Gemmataceae bacterium]|nr:hypothetical protein [Gemmataceae bacterium]